jgi:hypothetical protein
LGKLGRPFRAISWERLTQGRKLSALGYDLLPLRGTSHLSLFTSHLSHLGHTVGILNWLVAPCVSTLFRVFSYQRCMMLLYRV